MNQLRPSSATATSSAFINANSRRPFHANEPQPFYQRLSDSSLSSSTLALGDPNAAFQTNAEVNLTNMDSFPVGSSTPFSVSDHDEPRPPADSRQYHESPSIPFERDSRRLGTMHRENLEIAFLHPG